MNERKPFPLILLNTKSYVTANITAEYVKTIKTIVLILLLDIEILHSSIFSLSTAKS
jgi:hypothetical protein